MIQEFLLYFFVGSLLAWPAWKLVQILIYRTGIYKPKSRCFEDYVPVTGQLTMTSRDGPTRV